MQIKTNIGSSSVSKGIVEEYITNENIKSGEFVGLNEEISEETLLASFSAGGSYCNHCMTKVDSERFILTYPKNNILYARICTLANGVITVNDEEVSLKVSVTASSVDWCVEMIDQNKFIVVSVYNATMSAIVCGINSNSIETGVVTTLGNAISLLSINILNENKFFIFHTCNVNYRVNFSGKLCEIDNKEITVISSENNSNTKQTGDSSATSIKIANNKTLLLFDGDASLCTFKDNAINFGTTFSFAVTGNNATKGTFKAILLEENKILISFGEYGANARLVSVICNINQDELTFSERQLLCCNDNLRGISQKLIKLKDNRIFAVATKNGGTAIHFRPISIINDYIKPQYLKSSSSLSVNNDNIYLAEMNDKEILVTYSTISNGYQIRAFIVKTNKAELYNPKLNDFLGIAKTKANKNQKIKVYVPNIEN